MGIHGERYLPYQKNIETEAELSLSLSLCLIPTFAFALSLSLSPSLSLSLSLPSQSPSSSLPTHFPHKHPLIERQNNLIDISSLRFPSHHTTPSRPFERGGYTIYIYIKINLLFYIHGIFTLLLSLSLTHSLTHSPILSSFRTKRSKEREREEGER